MTEQDKKEARFIEPILALADRIQAEEDISCPFIAVLIAEERIKKAFGLTERGPLFE